MSEAKKALIFGATGQDGSYLSELLLSKGYRVYGSTRQVSVSNRERVMPSLQNSAFELVMADVTDASSVSRLVKRIQPDEIYFLAAQSSVTVSFDEPGHTFEVTAKGCLNVLEAIRSESPSTKFLNAGSSEIYGGHCNIIHNINENLENVETRYQNELTSFNPRSPYAVAKVAAHNFTKVYRESYGLFACSPILFNHESPRRGDNFVTRKITKYIGDLLNSEVVIPKLKLGNLEVSRDWGHARDVTRAMWMVLNSDKPNDYVVATGKTHSLKDFLNEAFNYVGRYWKDYVEIDPKFFRPNEVQYCHGDYSLIKRSLGWEPTISFKELVKEMVNADSNLEKRM